MTATAKIHYTFYTQPWLFFPRRIHAYLKLKPLPSDVVSTEFIPVSFGPDGKMEDIPGKPDGTIPMMRSTTDSDVGDGVLVRQSLAIIQYLEEVHPRTAVGAEDNVFGSSVMERARVNELVSLIEEASQALGFWCMQSSALYAPIVKQSPDAAQAAEGRMHKCLAAMEEYARKAIEARKWLADTDGMTVADICLGSLVEYGRDMYARDLTQGHDVVKGWMEMWEATEVGKPGGEKSVPEAIRMKGHERTN